METPVTSRIHRLFFLLFLVLSACATTTEPLPPEEAFRKGVELSKADRHREAIPYYEMVYAEYPQNEAVLWNLGIANAAIGEHSEALKYWSAYRKTRPDDWRSYAKLVQSYQALGDSASRDRERDALFEMRRTADADSEVAKANYYCREQTEIAGRKVFVYEHFEPKGDTMVFYAFIITAEDQSEDFRFSLGSYEATNRFHQETSPQSGKRLYHLDRYQGPNHWTYGFYEGKPSYETVRAHVVAILEGKKEPLSSTTVQ